MNNIRQMKREFNKGIEMMWAAHNEIGHKWKIPSRLVCVMYAATEATEVLNSLTEVVDNQEHYRNNPKDRNTKEEIADTIMMIGRYVMSEQIVDIMEDLPLYKPLYYVPDNLDENKEIIAATSVALEEIGKTIQYVLMNDIDRANFHMSMACFYMFYLLEENEYIELLEKKLNKYRTKILGQA